MSKAPGIPQGTRDFSPEEMVKRNYIFDTIKNVYKVYGFLPIETPAMEQLVTLLGKYGDEGDKLLFKVLNSGDFLSKAEDKQLSDKNSNKVATQICEKGLRYDLTVPFARYVVQHRNDITFPFKRYQVQPVWRADRPQKGRYREFFQCDADIIGSTSLLNELELLQIIDQVFTTLDVNVTIKLNNRKILAGLAQYIGNEEQLTDLTVAIDKIDKIGKDAVIKELKDKSFTDESITKLAPVFEIGGDNISKIDIISKLIGNTEIGKKGIEEVLKIFDYLKITPIKAKLEFDLTLARGLNYYTGAIIEVKANDVVIGSICGGGRYDNLTGIFGLPDVSGVGISFGADRIYDVLEQLGKFPENAITGNNVIFINFGEKEEAYCLPLLAKLRNAGINAEIYPESAKMKKQMAYADKKNFRFVIMVGENEINANKVTLKDMKTGLQEMLDIESVMKKIV